MTFEDFTFSFIIHTELPINDNQIENAFDNPPFKQYLKGYQV
jgi:hypothetical protein